MALTQAQRAKLRGSGYNDAQISAYEQNRSQPSPSPMAQQNSPLPEPDSQGILEKLLGLAPAAGSILGGLGGGVAGAPAAGVGAIPGGAAGVVAGTGAGMAVKELGLEALGKQKKSRQQLATESVSEPLKAGLLDLLTAGLFKGGSKIGSGAINILGKMGLKETGKQAEKFAVKEALGTGEEIFKETTRRGVTGSTKALIREADRQLSEDVSGSVMNKLLTTARTIKEPVPFDEMIGSSITRASGQVVGESGQRQVLDTAADFMSGEQGRVKDWADIIQLRTTLNNELRGKATEKMSSAEKAYKASVLESINENLPQVLKDITKDEQFWIRLQDAAGSRAAKTGFSKTQIGSGIGAGVLGSILGGPTTGAVAGVAGSFLPEVLTDPLFTTNVAKAGRASAPAVSGTGRSLAQILRQYLSDNQ